MEEVYANIDDVQTLSSKSSTIQEGPRRFLRASVLGLGLLSVLLLAGLIGLAVYYHDVTEERDRLKASLTKKTSEVFRLRCLMDKETKCPEGWRKFGCSCYLLSTEKASWEQSNCTASGAVTANRFEQEFLTNTTKESTWIGNVEMGGVCG
ncbi:C-type lectin domain family 4 member A-like [Trematomus bernacchii]|uniref:C-type lectin domain family 4 member A-like n=1 Tax=Trematomus bernacchii TaxID=40690 RepID=UPI00146BC6AE|nr:C-type lectin domain family 4 member A-like [Trematomus bernacchii]XP_033976092.1 C-type lectin domain family 4 member A-like [Trematomus bernacchii]XP_033976093.1 C-type lectin domain family 4 member A-like [Trematomus bernacchii]